MTRLPRIAALAAALTASLAGCTAPGVPVGPAAAPSPVGAAALVPAGGPLLTADGLGPLRIGERIDALDGVTLSGGEADDPACRIMTSAAFPGVLVLTQNGVIERLTLASHLQPPSTIRTDRGIGLGASEAEVRAAYAPLRAENHKYLNAPATNLYFGDAGTTSGLRFEIGEQREVRQIHAGRQPALGLVEGCS